MYGPHKIRINNEEENLIELQTNLKEISKERSKVNGILKRIQQVEIYRKICQDIAYSVKLTLMIQHSVELRDTQQSITLNNVKSTMHVICASKQVSIRQLHARGL